MMKTRTKCVPTHRIFGRTGAGHSHIFYNNSSSLHNMVRCDVTRALMIGTLNDPLPYKGLLVPLHRSHTAYLPIFYTEQLIK